ncbi:hypothetical protein [Hellea balneolensis]|uniref:hypothetical protein n=1 Tax=Hellea balneolensis TaxID=287478 RepID=UPI00047CABC0|nr:hypothetical protein [Hellea balneolensis]
MSAMIWLHEDALRSDHPVFKAAGEGAEAIFIWDDAYFQREGYSLKRLVFIYELLADLNITCLQGETEQLLESYADGRSLFIPQTPNPLFKNIIDNLQKKHNVTTVPDIPLVIVPDDVDLRRFFRFWNKAKKSALSPSTGPLL